AEAATGRVRDAEAELAAAVRRWKEAVAAAGLPKGLSPKQVRQFAASAEQIRQIQDRLARAREELAQRTKERDGLQARITQLVKDTRLGVEDRPAAEQLRALLGQLAEQEALMERRRAIRRELRQIRKKRVRLQTAIDRLENQRRLLFEEVGAADESEFRQRLATHARRAELSGRRDALQREIEAALAGCCSEDALRETIESAGAADIESRRQQLKKRLEACEFQVRLRYEKRGQLSEQLRALADNRTCAVKALEMAAIEERLASALRRWQVLAVTHRVLENVRKTYEATRQPEALQDASGYLKRMTQGRYQRVWTPLSDEVLLVDDAEGNPHGVETLSRGLREQLFLSLRLALVDSYARRGAALPVLLDDVLVNFDTRRAKAAARVLCDFAGAGHQVLVFTCHDHVAEMFQTLEVEVHRLPGHGPAAAGAGSEGLTSRRSGKRRRRAGGAPAESEPQPRAPEPEPVAQPPEAQPSPEEVEPFSPWEEGSDPAEDPPATSDSDGESVEAQEFSDDVEAA
ncbi:MAG: hypothetical protein NUV77_23495, partial [Thermoguttaceae bacterium]|nr:hypothetical protein [Thermoguttaceae bacterium]